MIGRLLSRRKWSWHIVILKYRLSGSTGQSVGQNGAFQRRGGAEMIGRSASVPEVGTVVVGVPALKERRRPDGWPAGASEKPIGLLLQFDEPTDVAGRRKVVGGDIHRIISGIQVCVGGQVRIRAEISRR
jgi:hypothetical protein